MCLTCGCGQPHLDMGEANITYDDLKRAADENGLTISETLERLSAAEDVERSEAPRSTSGSPASS